MFFTKKYKNMIKEIISLLYEIKRILNRGYNSFLTIGQYIDKNDDEILKKNIMERMDANRIDIFNKSRCDFHIDRYRFACEFTENKDVIDCASGYGYGADIISKYGRAKSVVGVEIDKSAYEYSIKHYSSNNVTFKKASILNLPFKDNSFDVFTSFETIEHIEDEEGQLKEVKRLLKRGGVYLVSTPNDWSETDRVVNPYHVRTYTFELLKETLSKHFEILKIYAQNSGTFSRKENYNQPKGISLINEFNKKTAECFIVVAKNNKEG